MPRVLRPGQQVRQYKILRELSKGNFALSYEAVHDAGNRVFFKQYKSPTSEVSWYRGFIKHQKDLGERLKGSRAQKLALQVVEAFEEVVGTKTFFQVFEFFDGGKDLKTRIEEFRARPRSVPWEDRLTYAKVFLAGLAMLHEDARIVHCDLKPENVYLVRDDKLTTGFQVKLIDMDFSILQDKKAPWHGYENYVGSPCYQSPEHLKSELAPGPESDVFTAALILHDLLGSGNPYAAEEDYARMVSSYRAPRIAFQGPLEAPVKANYVVDLLHRALDPEGGRRPSARELHLALLGRSAPVIADVKKDRPVKKLVEKEKPPKKEPEVVRVEKVRATGTMLRLIHAPEKFLEFHAGRTAIGSRLGNTLGEDGRFLDEIQFTIIHQGDGCWRVLPAADTTNETLLNGKKIIAETPLKAGDVLAVGREAKKVQRLPLIVHLE
jgi:serine/threonine protein kinase